MAITDSKNITLALVFALIASFSNALMSVFVKLIGDGQNTVSILFARFAIGFLIFLPWFLTDKKLLQVPNKAKIILRCVTTLLAMACVFYALKDMPVTNVLVLNNTFPLFMPILTLVFLKIKTSSKMILSIIIGFIGVVCVLQPHVNSFNWTAIIALLSGLLAALAMLQIRLLTEGSTSKQILFYLFLFCTAATGLLLPLSFQLPSPHQCLLLFCVGIFGAVYQLCLTLALQYATARVVSPIYFSCILFAGILDWWIWQQNPNALALFGMGLVVVGGLLTILWGKPAKK